MHVFVYGGAPSAPQNRAGWPELLQAALSGAPVFNLSLKSDTTIVDVSRSISRLPVREMYGRGSVAVVAMSYLDGRSDRVAPTDAALMAQLAVQQLRHRAVDVVLVVGPTNGGPQCGRVAPGFGSYPRWLKRTDRAVRGAVEGEGAIYVPLSDMPLDLTRDGVRPSQAGWRWVAEQVKSAILSAT